MSIPAPTPTVTPASTPSTAAAGPDSSFADYARRVLSSADPAEKVRLTNEAAVAWQRYRAIGNPVGVGSVPSMPARPPRPVIVHGAEMPTHRQAQAMYGVSHAVYLLHGLAHVELNAIDLAWDTAMRFGHGMPEEWYR
jgi:uncharacterized ferritin-like protein (DUF455 family)